MSDRSYNMITDLRTILILPGLALLAAVDWFDQGKRAINP